MALASKTEDHHKTSSTLGDVGKKHGRSGGGGQDRNRYAGKHVVREAELSNPQIDTAVTDVDMARHDGVHEGGGAGSEALPLDGRGDLCTSEASDEALVHQSNYDEQQLDRNEGLKYWTSPPGGEIGEVFPIELDEPNHTFSSYINDSWIGYVFAFEDENHEVLDVSVTALVKWLRSLTCKNMVIVKERTKYETPHFHMMLRTTARIDNQKRSLTKILESKMPKNYIVKYAKSEKIRSFAAMAHYYCKGPEEGIFSTSPDILDAMYTVINGPEEPYTPQKTKKKSREILKQEILHQMRTTGVTTFEDFSREDPDWLNSILHVPGIEKLIDTCRRFIACQMATDQSLLTRFKAIKPDSTWLDKILEYQGYTGPAKDEAKKIIAKVLHRVNGKKNGLYFVGSSNTGKTTLCRTIAQCYRYGESVQGSFMWQDAVGKELLLCEELLIPVEEAQTAKQIFEGNPCKVPVKNKDPGDVLSIPVIANSNEWMWKFCKSEEDAFRNRCHIFHFNNKWSDSSALETEQQWEIQDGGASVAGQSKCRSRARQQDRECGSRDRQHDRRDSRHVKRKRGIDETNECVKAYRRLSEDRKDDSIMSEHQHIQYGADKSRTGSRADGAGTSRDGISKSIIRTGRDSSSSTRTTTDGSIELNSSGITKSSNTGDRRMVGPSTTIATECAGSGVHCLISTRLREDNDGGGDRTTGFQQQRRHGTRNFGNFDDTTKCTGDDSWSDDCKELQADDMDGVAVQSTTEIHSGDEKMCPMAETRIGHGMGQNSGRNKKPQNFGELVEWRKAQCRASLSSLYWDYIHDGESSDE